MMSSQSTTTKRRTSRIWTTTESLHSKTKKFTMNKTSQPTSLISTPRTTNPQRLASLTTKMAFRSKLATRSECVPNLQRLVLHNNNPNTKLGCKTLTHPPMINSSPAAAKYLNSNSSSTFSFSPQVYLQSKWLVGVDALAQLAESPLKLANSPSPISKFSWAPTPANSSHQLSMQNPLQSNRKLSSWDPESFSKNVSDYMTTSWKAEWQPITWGKRT